MSAAQMNRQKRSWSAVAMAFVHGALLLPANLFAAGWSVTSTSVNLQAGPGTTPAAQTITVTPPGSASTKIIPSANWIKFSFNGQAWQNTELGTGGSNPFTLAISVDGTKTTTFSDGLHTGTVTIQDVTAGLPGTTALTIQVSLTIYSGAVLSIAKAAGTQNFSQNADGSLTPPQHAVQISNGGSGTMRWTLSSDASWLVVDPTKTSGTTNSGQTTTVWLTPSAAGKGAGTYSAKITADSPDAANAPQSVDYTMTLTQSGGGTISLSASPSSLSFAGSQGASATPGKITSVSNSGSNFYGLVKGADSWVEVALPNAGQTYAAGGYLLSINSGATLSLGVRAVPGSLSAGTYTSEVTFTPQGGSAVFHLPVTFVVGAPNQPALAITRQGANPSGPAGSVTPDTNYITINNSGSAGTSLTWTLKTYPTWMQPNKTSGSISNSNEIITFTFATANMAPGTYSAPVTIGSTAPNGDQSITFPLTITSGSSGTPPLAPTGVGFSDPTTSSLTLGWIGVNGATSYSVDVALDSAFSQILSGYNDHAVTSGTTLFVTGLAADTPYYARVRALNASGASANSAATMSRTSVPSSPPAAPSSISFSNATTTSLTLTWGAAVGASSYFVDVATVSDFSQLVTGYSNRSVGAVTSLAVTGLSADTPYFARVRAANTVGTSGNSATASGRTSSSPTQLSFVINGVQAGAATGRLYVGTSISAAATVAVSGTITPTLKYRVSLNGATVATPSAAVQSTTPFSLTTLGAKHGDTLRVVAVMNWGGADTEKIIVQDAVVILKTPEQPRLILPTQVTPADGAVQLVDPTQSLTGIERWNIQFLRIGDATASAKPLARAGTSATLSVSAPSLNMAAVDLVGGTYDVNVVAEDGLGRSSSAASARIVILAGSLGSTRVYPSPWRVDRDSDIPLTFDNMTPQSTVKIFTVAGHHVRTLEASAGSVRWDLKTDSGDAAASGLYFYVITNTSGEKSRGKFAIIR